MLWAAALFHVVVDLLNLPPVALWSCALRCSSYFNVIQVVGLVLLTVGGGIGPTHVTSVY